MLGRSVNFNREATPHVQKFTRFANFNREIACHVQKFIQEANFNREKTAFLTS